MIDYRSNPAQTNEPQFIKTEASLRRVDQSIIIRGQIAIGDSPSRSRIMRLNALDQLQTALIFAVLAAISTIRTMGHASVWCGGDVVPVCDSLSDAGGGRLGRVIDSNAKVLCTG